MRQKKMSGKETELNRNVAVIIILLFKDGKELTGMNTYEGKII